MHWYRTPFVLVALFPGHSPLCWRCGIQTGTLFHIFWDCPKIFWDWHQVLQIVHKLMEHSIFDNPAAVLLNLTPMSSKRYLKLLLKHLLNAARACIPSMWKQAPTLISQWFVRVNDIQQMEPHCSSQGQDRGTQYALAILGHVSLLR